MSTLFKVKFPEVLFKELKNVPSGDGYFYHSLLTDVATGQSESHIDYVVKANVDKSGAGLGISFGPILGKNTYKILGNGDGIYSLAGHNLALEMSAKKQPQTRCSVRSRRSRSAMMRAMFPTMPHHAHSPWKWAT